MNIREISDVFRDTASGMTAIKSYNFGWASDRVRQGNTEDYQELNEFPRIFFSVPTIIGSDQTRKQDTYQVTLFFDDLLGYDNEGDADLTLQIDKWASLQQYANYFIQRLNLIKQTILPNYLFIPEAPSIIFDSFTGIQRMVTVQLTFNLVVPTNCDIALTKLVECIANITTSTQLEASLTTVLKFAANLEARATLTADINFVQKAQASLLTSASVTGNITIPKLVQASLTGAGTTTADLTVMAAASLLLDLYPSAAVAYSLRKLRTAYTGSAIRVRRSSDNTEQDIGFTGNELDTTALTTFVGAGNGFVTTWYDQSGNARNATQTTQANQPQIVSSGSVLTTNNKPSLLFNRSHLFLNSALFSGANPRTILSVYKPNNSSGAFVYSIFGQSFNGSNGGYTILQSRTEFVVGDPYFAGFSQDLGNGLTTPNILQKLAQFNYNGTTGYLYKNNTLIQSANITLNAQSTGLTYIGVANFNGTITEYLVGNLQECIAWASNQNANTSGISNNINTHYGIY